MNVVILAAGLGKRMRSVLPKVLQPLAGRPMIEHVLSCVDTLVGARAIVVVGHGADVVKDALAQRSVHFALQSPQLGTGHALKCALDALDRTHARTAVCLGDVPLLKPATLQALATTGEDDELVLVTVNLPNPKGYGRIVRNDGGDVVAIVEEKDATDAQKAITEVNTGIMRFPTARLEGWLSELKNTNAQGEYYLTDVIALAVRDGVRITTVQPASLYEVEGVNSKTQLAALERVFQLEEAHRLLDEGVTLADPNRIDIRGTLTCGKDVFIDVGCVFEGAVHLEDGVTVGPYSVIKNTTVKAGSLLKAYTHSEGAIIGEGAQVGPFSRLRPGAELTAHNHVGNFVEIKNAIVGEGSKINHLTYVGDADVGARCNIGAGVITCNYDGANKHRTVIGDDVFVGSGVKLVAPITVGDGATIGAGGAVRKAVPAGELTVVMSQQRVIPGWTRPTKTKK